VEHPSWGSGPRRAPADSGEVLRPVLKAVLGSSRNRTIVWVCVAAGLVVTHLPRGDPGSAPGLAAVTSLPVAGYVAPIAGSLPRGGAPSVAGIRLPAGRRLGRGSGAWISNGPDPTAIGIAEELADAFPRTGLWPLLWDASNDPGIGGERAATDGVGEINVADALRTAWASSEPGSFPGLAAATPQPGPFNPFVLYATTFSFDDPPRYDLLVVSCRRPADAIERIGLPFALHVDGTQLAAILRSWASRFDAQVVGVAGDRLVVTTPSVPRSATGASALAAELVAVAGGPEGERASIAGSLIAGGRWSDAAHVVGWPHGWAIG